MKNFLRQLTPAFLLNLYRKSKKNKNDKKRLQDKSNGLIITKDSILNDLKAIGIVQGDTLLVHSSLSKIGFVENGPKDVVEALIEAVGPDGHLLMPNSPNAKFQLDYIKELDFFDVKNAPSKLGSISEYFRLLPAAKRSKHPTEPVSCIGPNADYFISGHFGELTPYTKNSPFYRVAEKKGKILYIGVTLDNAGTSLHLLEDLIEDFKFSVYADEIFDVQVLFENNEMHVMKTKVHNPEQSKKRKCDGLIPLFIKEKAFEKVQIGQAETFLVDANRMLEVMLKAYNENGTTMYTPKGS